MDVPVQRGLDRHPQQTAPERRRYERRRTRTPMYIVRVESDLVAYDAVCTDITVEGLGFNTLAQLRVGDVIEFEFVNADHAGLTCEARILYRAGEHYGAYFLRAHWLPRGSLRFHASARPKPPS